MSETELSLINYVSYTIAGVINAESTQRFTCVL